MKKTCKTTVVLFAGLLSLTGCGGGGGGGGGGSNNNAGAGGGGGGATTNPQFTHTRIDTQGATNAEFIQVAFNPTGQAVVLWRNQVVLDATLFANLFDPATGWGLAQQISSAPEILFDSQISMDANGDVAVVWRQSTSENPLLANTIVSGVAGTERLMGTGLLGEQIAPGLPGGPVAVALWEHIDANGIAQDALETAEFRLSTGWSATEVVPTSDSLSLSDDVIAVLGDGRRLAVWSDSVEVFRYSLWTPGLGWSPALRIHTGNRPAVLYLAAGSDSNAVLVWVEDAPPTGYTLFASWFDGTAWGPATPLSTQTGIIVFRDSVRVAADKRGNAVVVWRHIPGDPNDPATIRSVRYRNGAWEAPVSLSVSGVGPALAVNEVGDTVAVWREPASAGIVGRGFSAANPAAWSDPVTIVSGLPFTPVDWEVAMEPDGSIVVVWANQEPDDAGNTLWSSRGRIQ